MISERWGFMVHCSPASQAAGYNCLSLLLLLLLLWCVCNAVLQIMYFVGVSAILRSLGIINTTTRLAGSSGGAVAAAMNCGNAPIPTFITAASALAGSCRIINNCNGTLDIVARAGLFAALPADVHTRCKVAPFTSTSPSRLYISITNARQSNTDVEVKVSSFSSRTTVLNACAASSFIPRFSGIGILPLRPLLFTTATSGLGVTGAYNGVCTNPLPQPPSECSV